MLTFIRGAFTRHWDSRQTCSYYSLQFQEWQDGLLIGKNIKDRVEFLADKENNIARPFQNY